MSVADQIKTKLEAAFEPEFLELINESDKHLGHAGHDGSGESHFKLRIVSSRFEGKSRIERQRMVHNILKQELSGPVHALSVQAKAPKESYTL